MNISEDLSLNESEVLNNSEFKRKYNNLKEPMKNYQ